MRRIASLTIAIVVGLLVLPASGSAYTASPLWKCRASSFHVSITGMNRVEPIVANGNPSTANNKSPDRAQCATEEAGADNLATPLGIPDTVATARTASAKTDIEPELGLAVDQKVTATSRVEKLDLPLGGTSVVVGVGAANATVTGSCAGGAPKLEATSSILDLTIGGTPVSLNEFLGQLANALQPFNAIADVKFNEQVRDGRSLVVRAAHIKVLSAAGANPLADIVIAESKVDTEQFTCDPNRQVPGVDRQVCPTGSTYEAMTGVCIIRVNSSGSASPTGTQVIVVGRPFEGPSGGTVIPVVDARKRFGKLVCLAGTSPKYAVIGTSKKDRITGTNKRDRILGRGGNDSIDGGRGADCLDGGTGNDRMTGGIGSDRMIGASGNDTLTGNLDKDRITGGKGNDKVNGGPGADTLSGGDGRDIINPGFGADKVQAGRGNDIINIAVAGPRARVNCGSGKDKIRLNLKERRSIKGCETQYVLRDV